MVPQEFRTKIEEKGYIPSDFDRKRFIEEAEIVERAQSFKSRNKDQGFEVSRFKKRDYKSIPNKGRAKTAIWEKSQGYYCLFHGRNKGHNSNDCWSLHPEKKPTKTKRDYKSKTSLNKEINLISRADKTSRLEVINFKLKQLKELKASMETKATKKETASVSSQDSSSSKSSKSLRMVDLTKSIPRKKDRIKASYKPAKEITISPAMAKTKRKIHSLEKVTLEQVSPNEQEYLSKAEQLKRMLLKEVPKEEREFCKKAIKLCSDSSNKA